MSDHDGAPAGRDDVMEEAPDHKEGVASFMEKREPVFQGR